jgi:hypothetical protein
MDLRNPRSAGPSVQSVAFMMASMPFVPIRDSATDACSEDAQDLLAQANSQLWGKKYLESYMA